MPDKSATILVVAHLKIWKRFYQEFVTKSADRYIHISPSDPPGRVISYDPDKIIFHCGSNDIPPALLAELEHMGETRQRGIYCEYYRKKENSDVKTSGKET